MEVNLQLYVFFCLFLHFFTTFFKKKFQCDSYPIRFTRYFYNYLLAFLLGKIAWLGIAILRVLIRRQIQRPTAPRQLFLGGLHIVVVQVGLDVGPTPALVFEATEEGEDSDEKSEKIKNYNL